MTKTMTAPVVGVVGDHNLAKLVNTNNIAKTADNNLENKEPNLRNTEVGT